MSTRVHRGTARRKTALIPVARIERAILLVRHERVMVDADLAALYGVATRTLLQAVKRNAARFPSDFMFQLTTDELAALRSQIVISKKRFGRGGRRYAPRVFTEQGVAMLSSILRSERAVKVNIEIVRAFVRLRRLLATHADLAQRLAELERRYDGKFRVVFAALREVVRAPVVELRRRRIGFGPASEGDSADSPSDSFRTRAIISAGPAAGPRVLAGSALPRPASRRRRRR